MPRKAPLCKGGSARRAVGDCTGRPGDTIPPSPAVPPPFTQGRLNPSVTLRVPPPFTQGRLIADAQCASLHGVRPCPLPFRQTGVGTAIGRPRADVVIGPYGGPTEALFSRPFALKARGKGDHRRWWKGHLTSLVKDKERKNSHTLPALASPTPPSLSPREGSVRRRRPHADRQGCRSLRSSDGKCH